jgi:hypothetical protein
MASVHNIDHPLIAYKLNQNKAIAQKISRKELRKNQLPNQEKSREKNLKELVERTESLGYHRIVKMRDQNKKFLNVFSLENSDYGCIPKTKGIKNKSEKIKI